MNRTGVASALNCPGCLGPSQSMVFGRCQHFVCASCLYEPVNKRLRPLFRCCPICKDQLAFPMFCPVIPDTTKKMMKIAGVVKCPRERCGKEMWASDKEEHEQSCIAQRSSARGGGSSASASTSQTPTTRQSN